MPHTTSFINHFCTLLCGGLPCRLDLRFDLISFWMFCGFGIWGIFQLQFMRRKKWKLLVDERKGTQSEINEIKPFWWF